MEVTVQDMMTAREARYGMQQILLGRYPGAVLVCLTMNIAGPIKTNPAIERAFQWGMARIGAVLMGYPNLFQADIHEKTGPEAVFAVTGDATEIKRRLCALEDDCAMGRLLDVDVIGSDGMKLSRTDVGLPARKCLLCGQDAPVCARSRTHTASELFARTQEIIAEHFTQERIQSIARLAERALLHEVAITPKPGLVDRANSGAHTDMDVFTFLDSACALRDYFETCARIGVLHRGDAPENCLPELRGPGLEAEAIMRKATGNVNTHKGAIFSLGLCCASLGMGETGESAETVLERCGAMTRTQMEKEMASITVQNATTHGEMAYGKQGMGGVRAEAASGFVGVRHHALPMWRKVRQAGLHRNDAGLCALVSLMACAEDTNAWRRGGQEAARQLRQKATSIEEEILRALEDGMFSSERLHSQMKEWDEELCAQHISPGGCADLLALTMLAEDASSL